MTLFERYRKLREAVKNQFSTTTQELVDKALTFAAERMEGLTRYDGSPMLDHAVEVAHIVATEVGLGRNSTVASILHDVVSSGTAWRVSPPADHLQERQTRRFRRLAPVPIQGLPMRGSGSRRNLAAFPPMECRLAS